MSSHDTDQLCTVVQGTKEYALQPGEHDALLEAQWGLTRGTLRKLNRGLTVGALPCSFGLKVPWHVRVRAKGLTRGTPRPGVRLAPCRAAAA